MQVKDLTVEELKLIIQETVIKTIQSLLTDSDEGKQVKPEVKQQLVDSLKRTQAGERGISASEVARRLGFNDFAVLDILRSRAVEQEVLDILDELD
ncbi:hypothetical protein NIES4071_68550 [Calothrix sp. NIES-4071]|nr:hypothetical protein NIES4071_68550 [Calothrix sp. NIES-4071]BAZ61133.1 hypothetical protein NIES4105_68510 [Calothrix sp. NIES-4105]